jgi:hypothetical protein
VEGDAVKQSLLARNVKHLASCGVRKGLRNRLALSMSLTDALAGEHFGPVLAGYSSLYWCPSDWVGLLANMTARRQRLILYALWCLRFDGVCLRFDGVYLRYGNNLWLHLCQWANAFEGQGKVDDVLPALRAMVRLWVVSRPPASKGDSP